MGIMYKKIALIFILPIVFSFNFNCSSQMALGMNIAISKEARLKTKLENNPRDYATLKKLGDFYCDKTDFMKAAFYYLKAVKINENEADLNKLGLILYVNDDYNNSLKVFEEAYRQNPQNEITRKKIAYLKSQIAEKQKGDTFDFTYPEDAAPRRLHNLIKVEGSLKDANDEKKLHKIIDFIWSDKEGKMLLSTLFKTKTPVYLKRNIEHSCFEKFQYGASGDAVIYGPDSDILVSVPSHAAISIYIKESDISDFQSEKSDIDRDMACMMVVIHEFLHSIRYLYYSDSTDSQEEELLCYLLGYNIASRIITGEPMSEGRIRELSQALYNLSFESKCSTYNSLQDENKVAAKFARLGFVIPYHYVYSDLSNLKMKETIDNPEVAQYVAKLNTKLEANFDTVFARRTVYGTGNVVIVKSGKIMQLKDNDNKFYGTIIKENAFNVAVATFAEPFPPSYKDSIIPLKLIRENKKVMVKFLGE